MRWRWTLVIGILLELAVGLSTVAATRVECPARNRQGGPATEGSCPYTITIQCWCEIPPAYVCCIRQFCMRPFDWAPQCNYCWFYEECYVQDCNSAPPESTFTLLDVRRPL